VKDPDNYPSGEASPPGATPPALLDGLKAGDEASRARLVTLYLPLVFHRYLARVPPEERPDLAQQVFATVFRKIGGFEKRFDGPAFRGWLYRISYHKVGDHIRRKRREARPAGEADIPGPAAGDDDEAGGPEAPDRDDEKAILVRRAMELARADFEPATYEAARQLLLEGRPADEVAAALGRSRNAIYIAKSRVLARVRAILTDLGEWGREP
jgi:RNA polymerase sigma-70 factor (ECF subfamily)